MNDQRLVGMTDQQLIAMGYRRTSSKYGMVSRIDRPDWMQVLAAHLNRSTGSFMLPNGDVDPMWCDFYRRVLSKDNLKLGPERGRRFPTSHGSSCGYVSLKPRVKYDPLTIRPVAITDPAIIRKLFEEES